MSDLSRRRLFGLLAGAAAAPLVKAAEPDLWLGGSPIFYDPPLVNPAYIQGLRWAEVEVLHMTSQYGCPPREMA